MGLRAVRPERDAPVHGACRRVDDAIPSAGRGKLVLVARSRWSPVSWSENVATARARSRRPAAKAGPGETTARRDFAHHHRQRLLASAVDQVSLHLHPAFDPGWRATTTCLTFSPRLKSVASRLPTPSPSTGLTMPIAQQTENAVQDRIRHPRCWASRRQLRPTCQPSPRLCCVYAGVS